MFKDWITHLPDASFLSWSRLLPPKAAPYVQLLRLDRPVGTWLLLLPALWGLVLADATPPWWSVLILAAGALFTRSAGCVINDMLDRQFDAQVARTAMRPLASGQLTLMQAGMVLAVLTLLSVGLFLLLPAAAQTVALVAVPLIILYPLAKRWLPWPQAWLAITFNLSVLIGYLLVADGLSLSAIVIYFSAIVWMFGYDTLYAMADETDDQKLGLHSTALYFGERALMVVSVCYIMMMIFWVALGVLLQVQPAFFVGVAAAALVLVWQMMTLVRANPQSCIARFRSNQWVGWALLLALLLR